MPGKAGATPASARPQARQNDCRARRRTAHRAHHPSAAVHAKNGPGDRFGDMALTGHSHRPGKITATTHLPR
jgi:hypothetical protein